MEIERSDSESAGLGDEEPQDAITIYDALTIDDGVLTVTSQLNDIVTIQPDGDDVIIDIQISEDPEGTTATEYQLVVPKDAFVAALVAIGVVESSF